MGFKRKSLAASKGSDAVHPGTSRGGCGEAAISKQACPGLEKHQGCFWNRVAFSFWATGKQEDTVRETGERWERGAHKMRAGGSSKLTANLQSHPSGRAREIQ